MLKRLIHKTVKSVFAKLLIVMVLTGILINLLFAVFFGHVYKALAETAFDKNIRQYISYIIRDLGTPPSLKKALALKEKTSVDIRFEGPDLATSWSTFTLGIPPQRIRWHIWKDDSNVNIGHYRRHHFVRVATGPGVYTFKVTIDEKRKEIVRRFGFVVLLALPLIMTAAFLVMRRILKPIAWLTHGVHQVSLGNLKHRIVHRRSDELGRLADAFNTMTQRVESMLDAREQLLLDVSHELRSPLTRMKVALEFLPDSETKTSLGEDLTEMGRMVSEILEMARLRNLSLQLNLELVNIGTLIKDVATLVAPAGESSPPIVIHDLPDSLMIHADADKVRVVFKNIFENAIKYSSHDADPVIVTLTDQEPYAVVRIKDGGIGIEPDELTHIFQPFFRADKSRSKLTGGYGLGLSICKRIMEAHKGKIEISSRPGQGTTVSLSFRLKPF
jgi:signal transduction histidine kinase